MAFDRMRANFLEGLSQHPDPSSVNRRCFVGPDFAVFLLHSYPAEDVQGIRQELHKYYPICSLEEIRRIEQPATASDILLKIRADEIASSTRLHRVFLRRRALNKSSWQLSTHFSTAPFESYVFNLPDEERRICEQVAAGTAFLLQPNGLCVATPWGPVVVISETLEHYLYYMNVFLLSQHADNKIDGDASQALYIAMRIMSGAEAPDFDLDPRGTAAEPLNSKARSLVQSQIDFIVGHEYAHILGGHVRTIRRAAPGVLPLPGELEPNVYSPLEEQEFAADLGSLLYPQWSKRQLIPYVGAAHWFFYGLDLLEEMNHYLNPKRPRGQHPSARERLFRLRTELMNRELFDHETYGDGSALATTIKRLDQMRARIREILPQAGDQLQAYGSHYLAPERPSGLFDRIHY